MPDESHSDPKAKLIELAKAVAKEHALQPELVCAICEQESGWDTWAMRYESDFYKKYIAGHLYTWGEPTEAHARATSWGLMQVMGQVAREHGFVGKFLSELCDPETGLRVGCKVFCWKLDQAHGDQRKALLLWNVGGRPEYADEVLARVGKYQRTMEAT
jgi:soluble lytic murein transglycosylase-like protein